MATRDKPELGTKRVCGNCAQRFFDMDRSPIHCPKCQAVCIPPPPIPSRPTRPFRIPTS